MKKRIISLSITLLLIVSGILTGCSGKKDNTLTLSDSSKNVANGSSAEEEKTAEQSYDDKSTDSNYVYDTGESPVTSKDSTTDSSFSMVMDGFKAEEESYYGSFVAPGYGNTEEYTKITETGFKDTVQNPLSTFSIDVDTAAYTNLRKNLNYGIIPPADAVRIEEMLNYFTYDYEEPSGEEPFSIQAEIGRCPWNEDNYLLMVGLQGINVDKDTLPKSNLVFLIDVSGSMDEPDKLPLLKNAFSQLVKALGENDRISIVVYAGASGVVLDSVRGSEEDIILDALDSLEAGGSTGGAEGIELAYKLAKKNFIKGGNNRVILATDGDFNVGPSSVEELEAIISKKKESGIFLSVIGFGSGNLKDNRMETLADKGNGNYSYIDSTKEARKVLVDEMAGTLLTIAKDVKIQLEFNPMNVAGYRLIGYENRALRDKDFEDDTIDAGELGAGHRVSALYEIIPAGAAAAGKELKYQSDDIEVNTKYKNEITEIRLRYKKPDQAESRELKKVVTYENTPVDKEKLSEDFYFASAIAEFGMLLRDSSYKGNTSLESVMELAEKGLGNDEDGYRLEFMLLVDRYKELLGYRW